MKTFTLKQCKFKIVDQRSDFVAVFLWIFSESIVLLYNV